MSDPLRLMHFHAGTDRPSALLLEIDKSISSRREQKHLISPRHWMMVRCTDRWARGELVPWFPVSSPGMNLNALPCKILPWANLPPGMWAFPTGREQLAAAQQRWSVIEFLRELPKMCRQAERRAWACGVGDKGPFPSGPGAVVAGSFAVPTWTAAISPSTWQNWCPKDMDIFVVSAEARDAVCRRVHQLAAGLNHRVLHSDDPGSRPGHDLAWPCALGINVIQIAPAGTGTGTGDGDGGAR